MKLALVAVLLAFAPALVACNDDSETPGGLADAGPDQSADDAAKDAPAADSPGTDAADATDAACTRAALSFACGTATCTAAAPICCNDHATCVADATQCPKPDGSIIPRATIECDDADDCGDGKVCCSSFNKGNNFTDYFCRADCGQIAYGGQVCKQSCECLGGKACTDKRCQ
jgi:hypothetical protein